MTKYQLMQLLFATEQPIITINGLTGTLVYIEREDGSGSSFNVAIRVEAELCGHTITRIVKNHVRTVD